MDALSAGAVNDVGVNDVGVFEHPGWLEPGPEAACTEEVCITCSDEGRVAEVTAVYEDGRAEVLARGRRETIDASLVDAGPGDLVLVHAGVALTLLEKSTNVRSQTWLPRATAVKPYC